MTADAPEAAPAPQTFDWSYWAGQRLQYQHHALDRLRQRRVPCVPTLPDRGCVGLGRQAPDGRRAYRLDFQAGPTRCCYVVLPPVGHGGFAQVLTVFPMTVRHTDPESLASPHAARRQHRLWEKDKRRQLRRLRKRGALYVAGA